MGQGDGLSADFAKGRLYERRETLSIVAHLLNLQSFEEVQAILQVWALEAAESLELPKKRVIVIEDTYILV